MDYLQERIAHNVKEDPGFAEAWAPFAIMGQLVDERLRLGLSQTDVARRMGIGQPAVARMENVPDGVAFARILAYAAAIGAGVRIERSKAKPVKAESRGRRPRRQTVPA